MNIGITQLLLRLLGWCRNKSSRRSSTGDVSPGIFCWNWCFVDNCYNTSWWTQNPEIQVYDIQVKDANIALLMTFQLFNSQVCRRKKWLSDLWSKFVLHVVDWSEVCPIFLLEIYMSPYNMCPAIKSLFHVDEIGSLTATRPLKMHVWSLMKWS